MKKTRKILLLPICICSVIAVTFIVMHLPPQEAFCSHDYHTRTYRIHAEHAPEGTAELDLLVRMNADSPHYNQHSHEVPYAEISRYHEDSYSSVNCYYIGAHDFETHAEDGFLTADFTIAVRKNEKWDFEQMGDYKIAYIDKNGKLLGVTDQATVRHSLDPMQPTVFTANGSQASCVVYDLTAHIALTALKVAAVHLLVLLLIWFLRRRNKHTECDTE